MSTASVPSSKSNLLVVNLRIYESDLDLQRHIRSAVRKVCRDCGYNADGEPEYESAMNLGIWDALKRWEPGRGRTLVNFACKLAVHRCSRAKAQLQAWQRQDRAGAGPAEDRGSRLPPADGPAMPLLDRQILEFVAAHGRGRAAKLLGMGKERLAKLLDDVFLRNSGIDLNAR